MCGLLLDEILQFIDASNLCVPGRSVNRAFFSLFPKLEDIVGNLIVGFLVVSFFEKLFLELLQSFVNAISGILLSASDHLWDVLLELCLIGGLIAKERVDGLNEYYGSNGSSAIIRFSLASYSAVLLPATLCYIFRT